MLFPKVSKLSAESKFVSNHIVKKYDLRIKIIDNI